MGRLAMALERVLDKALAVHKTTMGLVQLVDRASGLLVIVCQRGFDADFLAYFSTMPTDGGCACAQSYRTGNTAVLVDTEFDEAFAPHRAVAAAAGFRSLQSTPILSTSGALLGVLSTHFAEPREFSPGELAAIRVQADAAREVMERALAGEEPLNRGAPA
jgi:GAF domain-containing protein